MTTNAKPLHQLPLPILLTALTAFLIPFLGGQISTEPIGLAPGIGSVLGSLYGGNEASVWAHALLVAPALVGLVYLAFTRKIFQTPVTPLLVAVSVFLGFVGVSVVLSHYRTYSIVTGLEFLVEGIVFFAVIASVGRQRGPLVVLGALFAGVVVLALLGLREYASIKADDPSWRIFAGWAGPNALAGMLLVGFFVGLGLLWVTDRAYAILVGIGLILIGFALGLTQSKGAILSMVIVLPIGLGFAAALRGERPIREVLGRPLCVILLVGILIFGVQMQGKRQGTSAGATSRITDFSSTSEQSAGFRANLWKGAIQLVKQNPVGVGIGSYRFESARSGLTTQTVLAHQTYLQLAAETSPLGLLAFLGMVGLWLWNMLKNARKIPGPQNLLRIGAVCAVGALLAHSMTESALYYFGLGLSFWLLLGVTVLLAGDSVSPEFVFPQLRWLVCGTLFLVWGAMLVFGRIESARNRFTYDLAHKDLKASLESLEELRPFSAIDADAMYLIINTAEGYSRQIEALRKQGGDLQQLKDAEATVGPFLMAPAERFKNAETLVKMAPTTRNLRLLARAQRANGDPSGARLTLREALRKDPISMPTLNQLLADAQEDQSTDDIREAATALVDSEASPAFKIRSLPDLVPTETYRARLILAKLTKEPKAAIALLEPAIQGYLQYVKRTIPQLKQMASAGMNYGGEDIERAKVKMAEAEEAARLLATLQRAEARGTSDAEAAAGVFAGAFSEAK